MKSFLLLILISSTLGAAETDRVPPDRVPPDRVQKILKKYKSIKEEMKDRKAEVMTTDAIIFADVGLEYPVHKLKKGRIINLANFEVKLENVHPVLINGGVGYVRSGDIKIQKVFENQAASRLDQHSVDYAFDQSISRLNGRTNFVAKYSSFTPGSNWSDFAAVAGDKAQSIKAFQFLVEFHPKNEAFGFGIGPSHYRTEQRKIKLSTWAFEGEIFYKPARWRLFEWDLHAGAGFSSGLNITVSNIEGVNKGYFYSWNLGSTLRFLPDYKFGAVLGLNYRTWNISGMKEVVFDNGTVADLNGFSGADIFLGLSYKFK